MANLRIIAKNTSLLLVSQIISYIFLFVYTIYIARYLGADGFGTLSFALAFSGIFSILADLGLSTLTVREVARDKSLVKKYLGNVLSVKIILSFLTFGLILLFINLLNYPQSSINVVFFVSLSLILNSIVVIFYSIFQAFEEMEYQSIGQILNSILMFTGVLIAIYLSFNVIGISFIYFISSTIVLIYIVIIYLWKFSVPKLEYNLEFWKKTTKEALPFGLTGLSVMIYIYIDSVMLSLFRGEEVVGWYNAAYRLILFLVFIPETLNTTLFPSMSKFHFSSQESLKFMNEKYFKFMIAIGIPLVVRITILAEKLILLLFGPGYEQSIIALKILAWTLLFIFGGAVLGRLLEATNKQFVSTKITGISAIVNILLNLVLIPKFGLIGACISTVLTEIFLFANLFRITNKLGYGMSIKKIRDILIKIILSCFTMAIFLYYLMNVNLVISIVISIFSYFVTLYLVKGIDDNDLDIIRQLKNS